MAKAELKYEEKIRKAFIKAIDRSRLSYFKYCMRAGSCAYACHFWLVDPRHELVPGIKGKRVEDVFKKEFTVLGKIKRKITKEPLITIEELKKWVELSYGYCSLCDRCMLACPYSVEFPPLTLYMRVVLHEAGLTPDSVQKQVENELKIGHPYGITKEDWLRIISDIQSKFDKEIPVDKKGAKYLLIPGKRSLKDNLNSFIATIDILLKAKEDFTLSSNLWSGCMATYDIGAWDEMTILTRRRTKIIRDLEVKTIILTNDACGYYGWRWLADKAIREKLGFGVIDISELLAEYVARDVFKLNRNQNDFRATYHDPCHLARKGGIVEEPRKAIKPAVRDYVEMPHYGIYSICCTAGCLQVDEYMDTRAKAFKVKLDDILATNANVVITNCDECYVTFKRMFKEYNVKDIELKSITEIFSAAIS